MGRKEEKDIGKYGRRGSARAATRRKKKREKRKQGKKQNRDSWENTRQEKGNTNEA